MKALNGKGRHHKMYEHFFLRGKLMTVPNVMELESVVVEIFHSKTSCWR